ncbi:AAA family ATPase [Agathobaculum butyriciproducens]|nr:AAA family ATPase [Agathobaculum butyriciproducens]
MFDQEKLVAVIAAYKDYFPNHWKDEKYKWEAIQYFQEHWNISAENFLDMFMEATDKTYNLLANMNNYPRGMIKSFAMADPEAVRSMFMALFDESQNLAQRIEQFITSAEDLRVKYDDGTWKQHYQTANAISTYLWLKYPDKYYIYKYSEVRAIAREIGSDFIPKKGGSVSNIENSYKLYDEIRKKLASDSELDEILQNVLNEDCYPDPRKITMTLDVGFFVSRFYNQQKEIDLNSLHSDAKFSKWYAPVIESLYKMGGSGKRPDVHQKIIKDYGITDDELKVVNSTGNAQVLNDIDWARNYLVYEGVLDKGENGLWTLTELGKKLIITEELASKLTAKWVKIKTAEREHRYVPDIDLTPYYVYRTDVNQNSIALYTKEDFLNEVYMAEENYNTLVGLLKNKKNLILQGAPGVGKTFAAKRLAYSIMGEKDDSRIEFVQFHQNYSYEDFIMGYKPQDEGFKLTNGIFYQFCMNAAEHPDKDYFFIIDEINRGNMSKIFGELLMLIEKDYRGTTVTLAYSGTTFSVPKNLYIIGMMNTADRSLAMIDYALRRRFSFYEMEPEFNSEGFKAYQASLKNETFNALIEQIIDLNREINIDDSLGSGFRIGHSYFCGQEECTEEWMKAVVYYDIIPMLQEYWFDDRQKVKRWENLLIGVFND